LTTGEGGVRFESFVIETYSSPVSKVIIPVLRLTGRKPGPRLTVVAGMNASEYTGTQVCLDLFHNFNGDGFRGQLSLIPCANPTGIDRHERYSVPLPNDFEGDANLERIFPGDSRKSPAMILARSLFDFIVGSSDFIIDIHGGDSLEDIVPCALYTLVASRNERSKLAKIDLESKRLARSTGLEWVIEGFCHHGERGRLNAEVNFKGIPAIGLEASGRGILSKSHYEQCLNSLLNVMAELNMTDQRLQKKPHQNVIRELVSLRATRGGMLITKKQVGDLVEKGEEIGYLLGLNGDIRENLASPETGVLVEQRTNPVVFSGEIISDVGLY
jgi:uncharacterized protein